MMASITNNNQREVLGQFISVRIHSLSFVTGSSDPVGAQRDPNVQYTFDSERDASQSEICRQGKGKGKECIIVRLSVFAV
jgi:hypothetical protein